MSQISNGNSIKKTILHLTENKSKYYILKKLNFELEYTDNFTSKFGWNTTYAYLYILYDDVSIENDIKSIIPDLETLLREKLDLGTNNSDARYIILCQTKFKLSLDNSLDFKPSFENIERQTIDALNEANYFIWVAMAWITSQKIIDTLNKKANQGLNIQVIFNNDNINNSSNYFKEHINLQLFPKDPTGSYNTNIMHNKFCIIDGKKVINGSYNWSKKAEYNKENISVIETNSGMTQREILDYMDEFIKLKQH